MSRFTYNEAISTNATHETCESKLLLFSSFVFDDWHNDMPIAWIITSQQQEENFIDWLLAFKHHTFDQKPSCFTMDNAP